MPGELIAAASILAGSKATAWFAGKVFGPSAEAIGDNLKVYLQSRIPAIFAVAAEKSQEAGIEPKPLRPGLLARMITDASFSSEEAEITDWWANLFVSASMSEGNLHAVFSDMMAVIGPKEAQCLDEFFASFDFCRDPAWFKDSSRNLRGISDLIRDEAVAQWVGDTPVPIDRLIGVHNNLIRGQAAWPMRPKNWALSLVLANGDSARDVRLNPWFEKMRESVEVLERTRILRFARVDIPVFGPSLWVETVEATGLGVDFFAACKGFQLTGSAP